MLQDFVLTEGDKKALERMGDFLPDKIFDMHMHPGEASTHPGFFTPGSCFLSAGEQITMAEYERDQMPLYGTVKKFRANMINVPDPKMLQAGSNARWDSVQFIVKLLEENPDNVAEIPVMAHDTKELIESFLVHPRIKGFKCYHLTADADVTWQCGIGEYLPEAAWQVADERGMCITLHMVRDLALADEGNMAYICEMAAKYPNAKLILAHAGRGFAGWTVIENVDKLAPYPNVYFDLSAVCEPLQFVEIIRTVGHKRVFWGTDYPVSMLRGKCISIGAEFLWLYKEQLAACGSKTNFNAYLVGVEALLAVRAACRVLNLDRQAVEDIFYNNAMEFFGLED